MLEKKIENSIEGNNKELKINDEIGIQELITELRLWRRILIVNKWKLLLVGIFFSTIAFIYSNNSKPEYTATTRFMLKNEGVGSLFGGQMSTLSGLLGGGQMGTPLERTAEVIASDRIIGKVLLKEMKINDSNDLVINHFLKLGSSKNIISKDTSLRNVEFKKNDNDLKKLNKSQKKILKIVKNLMTPEDGKGIVRKSFDKKSGVLSIFCVHTSENFAIGLSEIIFKELSNFFVEQMTYAASNNADVMRIKLDSIESELQYVRKKFAQQSDNSLGLLLQSDKVDLKKLSIKEQMLTIMYSEALKNYESFQFINQAAMPSLTLIDAPYSPIKPKRKNVILYTTLSFFGSLLLFWTFYRIKYSLEGYLN